VSGAYYNEIDEFCVAWLKNLILIGAIADGDVDNRDIRDVSSLDLVGYTQHHFFAGIGGWSRALRLAGWPDDRPVCTGSCPCQPFSAAGKGLGFADERHLWPSWFWLIEQCGFATIFGEQVASPAGRQWLDLVAIDCEGLSYAFAAANLPAASVKAPHLRERLWWLADANSGTCGQRRQDDRGRYQRSDALSRAGSGRSSVLSELAESGSQRREGLGLQLLAGGSRSAGAEVGRGSEAGGLALPHGRQCVGLPECQGCERHWPTPRRKQGDGEPERSSSSFWSDCDWIPCRDGKYRPVEPGTFPLAHGVPNRVGRLRGYGNAINPEVAAVFIRAYLESVGV